MFDPEQNQKRCYCYQLNRSVCKNVAYGVNSQNYKNEGKYEAV
jgi:hypothetical protein